MGPVGVVEGLGVVEDGEPRLVFAAEQVAVDELGFDGADRGFALARFR